MERIDFNNVTPVEQGGTGENNAKDAANKFINNLPVSGNTPTDEDCFISQYENGNALDPVKNEYYRRPLKALWNYIKSKADAIYSAIGHKHAAGDITSGTLPIGRGGTGLNASPSILINLAATVADSVFKSAPRPGVTGTLPVTNGGTGATTAANARTNLGLSTAVTGASISGKTITLTKADGTTQTLTTQDTTGITTNKVPNYSAGVKYSCVQNQEVSFTCSADGVIVADIYTHAKSVSYLTINGVYMFNNPNIENIYCKNTGEYIVKQGDVIRFKTTYSGVGYYALDAVTFYPYR